MNLEINGVYVDTLPIKDYTIIYIVTDIVDDIKNFHVLSIEIRYRKNIIEIYDKVHMHYNSDITLISDFVSNDIPNLMHFAVAGLFEGKVN
jgi:hypothetical protein